jgi:hypothetical protein
MSDRVMYVYGIVPAELDATGVPPGLDGEPVDLVGVGGVAALASRLPAATYDPSVIESRVGDVAWLGPRAVAHDEVLSWAGERGAVVPLAMFTIYRDPDALAAMLRARANELAAVLARLAPGQEYAVRVFRVDRDLVRHLGELSPEVAELEAQARAAPPGQRYLLERKTEAARRAEAQRVAGAVAREAFDMLAASALEAVTEPPPRQEGGRGSAVLHAFFLVRRDGLDPFREALTALVATYGARGFTFEFTGPWPPYHFARTRDLPDDDAA